MTVLAAHQPEYFPPLRTVHKLASADVVVLLTGPGVMFDRGSCQHRARVWAPWRLGAGGWCWLTIPYEHQGRLQALAEVLPALGLDWVVEHSRRLRDYYAHSAPYWNTDVAPWLDGEFFCALAGGSLRVPVFAVATLSVEMVLQRLGCGHRILTDVALGIDGTGDATGRLIACCRAVGADVYLSGRTGAAILDRERFAAAGVEIRVHEFEHPCHYEVEPSVLHDWATMGTARLLDALPVGTRS